MHGNIFLCVYHYVLIVNFQAIKSIIWPSNTIQAYEYGKHDIWPINANNKV